MSLTALGRAEMMRSPTKDQSYQTKTRLGSSVADYLAFKRMSGAAEATLSQYERDLARLCVRYEHTDLPDVTSEDLLHAIGAFTVKQQRRVRAVYSDFFKWAFLWGKVDENPTLRLPVIKNPEKPHVETFTKGEQSALCGLLPLRDRVLMLILFETGIRKGEARAMRLKDWLPYENCEVRVPLGKGRKSRVIPVPPLVIHALAELEIDDQVKPDSYLWYGVRTNQSSRKVVRDHPVPEGTFFRWWQRCLGEAEVEYRPKNYVTGEDGVHNPHTTRHSYATDYLRDGGSIHILSDNLGHSSVAITHGTYSHLVTADRRADLDRVLSQREKR